MIVKGQGLSLGIAVGEAVFFENNREGVQRFSIEHIKDNDIEHEINKFTTCRQRYIELINKEMSFVGENHKDIALILKNYIAVAQDVEFINEVQNSVKANLISAKSAVIQTCIMYRELFANMDNEVLKQRASDFDEMAEIMVRLFDGVEIEEVYKENCEGSLFNNKVLVINELQVQAVINAAKQGVRAIVAKNAGKYSHGVIAAGTLGIPLISVTDVGIIKNGDRLIVDCDDDIVYINPEEKIVKLYNKKILNNNLTKKELLKYTDLEPVTKSGKRVELCINIGNKEEACKVLELNAQGIGLFRTEFIYMNRETSPAKEEQVEIYEKVMSACAGRKLVIRTMDIGGDKKIQHLNMEEEENPFLGLRGIRLSLEFQDFFKIQLESILEASGKVRDCKDLSVMIPMVSTLDEICEFKHLWENVKAGLREKNISFNENIKIGIMIETPAAVLKAKIFAKEVDFFSIGTNDLTQYIMAADRNNKNVSKLYNFKDDAVVSAIAMVVNAARECNIDVCVCGEMASDLEGVKILMNIGVNKFSLSSNKYLDIKKAIIDLGE